MNTVKELHKDYQAPDDLHYLTEKAIYYVLMEKGLKPNKDFTFHVKIGKMPFNTSRKHEVDLVLKSCKGEILHVEIKGQMTYIEVNKLRFLHEIHPYFYILQLTEIDWIEPYNKNKHKSIAKKSKDDFEHQIQELVSFVKGNKTGKELSDASLKRLNEFIEYRGKDLERWKEL
ncbi:MAG: hypothetical protein Q4D30_11275 [Bacteroidales bacterium]|nr:hypothetical protein [Bacteroidales bacterium]